jgi:agmatine deiminase
VELLEVPLDDCWIRDSGPVVVRDGSTGDRTAVQFGFNAWGGLVEPWDRDATIATRLAGHLGLPVRPAPFVLEGGAVAVDGDGLVVTTERCLLHPNRGPLPDGSPRTAATMEELLAEWLGAEQVLWLRDGLADDTDTDGHVDNVVALPRPGTALLQACEDPADPDAATADDNRARLEAAGLDVVELPVLPRTIRFGRAVEVPYVNLYAANGVVVVPVTGHPADDDVLEVIGDCYPGRDVQPINGATFAFGGGGPHCATQQVPA